VADVKFIIKSFKRERKHGTPPYSWSVDWCFVQLSSLAISRLKTDSVRLQLMNKIQKQDTLLN